MHIACDIEGDKGPQVQGVIMAMEQDSECQLTLVAADEHRGTVVGRVLGAKREIRERIQMSFMPEIVDSSRNRALHLREMLRNNQTTMSEALSIVRNGNADAMLTSGSTAAFVALSASRHHLGKSIGLHPALMAKIPTLKGHDVFLLDAGANPNAKPNEIAAFSELGVLWAKSQGVQKPSVSLLANGVELGKGTEELQETMKILQTNKNLHFIGNVEPEHVIAGEIEEGTNGHAGDINVVATDGHTGNIFLKMYQAAPKGFLEFSKQELKRRSLLHPKTWIQIVSAKAVSGLFRETRRKLKDRVGAAMLVGVKAPVFKIHGSSTPEEFASGIVGTHQMLKNARETGILQQLYGNGDHRNEKVAM